jgi:hypothetical protein
MRKEEPLQNTKLIPLTPIAPHHPKPLRGPASRRQQPRSRLQSQRLPLGHVALRRDERGLQAVLGGYETQPHVCSGQAAAVGDGC